MQIIGCIIAGGKSSRMGKDKKHLAYKETTFIKQSISLLKTCCDNVIINTPERYLHYKHIKDITKDIGPLGGIYSVLRAINNDVTYKTKLHKTIVIFIPVDMPNLTQDILNSLINKTISLAQSSSKEKSMKFKDYIFPFSMILENNTVLKIEQLIQQQKHSLKNLLIHIGYIDIPLEENSDLSNFDNINNPLEYSKLQK